MDRGTWRLVRQKVRLPSLDGSPLRSPEAARLVAAGAESGAVAPEPLGDGPPTLGTWQVRGVLLEPVRAAQLLASLPVDGRVDFPSVQLGTDIRYWSGVAKLILELLARQRCVPT